MRPAADGQRLHRPGLRRALRRRLTDGRSQPAQHASTSTKETDHVQPSTLIDADISATSSPGEFFTPADPSWDVERAAWNLAVDQHPDLVAVPETADDVVVLVEAARAGGMRVAAQGTGHNAAALGDLGRTMLLRTSRMRGVEVDPVVRTARVEAGVTWGEVAEAVAAHRSDGPAGLLP